MEITQELLDKYYLGQCTLAEKAAVENWLAEEETFGELPEAIDIQALEDRQWQQFSKKLAGQPIRQKKTKIFWALLATATAASFLLFVANIFYFTRQKQEPLKADIQYTEVSTKPGQKAQFQLSDGTAVYLNAASTIRYPTRFAGNRREVYLRGEAYFAIATDAERPFTVRSPQTLTQVLGTRFNLRAYPDEKETTLVVTSGRVNFAEKEGKHVLSLQAGQLGRYHNGRVTRLDNVSTAKYIAWKQEQLIFEDEPLSSIFKELERWYGVHITVSGPLLLSQRYTGQFKQASLQKVLRTISFAIPFIFDVNNNQVFIKNSP